ncbi:MAG TPA: hypothetical protein VIY96_01330 [Thermoanaerobaculia bacterium]
MKIETDVSAAHLTDDELAALVLPPTGAPEPLPSHLSACLGCSRLLAEWKVALSEIGEEDEEAIVRRPSAEWRAAEEATLAAIRRAGAPGRGRARTLKWSLPIAASLLLFGLLIGERRASQPGAFDDTTGLSAADRADDALLRDVDRLASGDEAGSGWSALAPDPSADESAPAAEKRS